MTIDEFNVSEECRFQLKRVGFREVDDLVELLERAAKGQLRISARWIRHFDEIIEELKNLGLWTETMEQAWQSDE